MGNDIRCACGSGQTWSVCCEPVIRGTHEPETAQQLLRARYTAFTRREIDFILDTHHPRTRDEVSRESIQEWSENAEWLGLEIHEVDGGFAGDDRGRVRFTARYRQAGHEIEHTEEALFERLEGRWYFVTGRQPPARRSEPKIGRNDPCPCGSGRKYKRCCLAARNRS